MIHVAPCSCELHVRIRELEVRAETAEAAMMPHGPHCFADIESERQRAENAEVVVATQKKLLQRDYEESQRLLARVAELEAEAWDAHMEHGPGRHCRRCEPAPAIEGHEREAD